MKRTIVKICLIVAAAALSSACGNSSGVEKQLLGKWLGSVPGTEFEQGIEFRADGTAVSVNMATLQYESWRLECGKLLLEGTSIGNGISCGFCDTLDVVCVSADSLVLSKKNLVISLARE